MKVISIVALLIASSEAVRISKDKITNNPKGFTDANIQPNDDDGANKWQMDKLKKYKEHAKAVEKAAGKAKTATSWPEFPNTTTTTPLKIH